MKKGFLTIAAAALLAASFSVAAEKRQLEHSDLDNLKALRNVTLSRDGSWVAFTVNPYQGDSELRLRETKSGREIVVPRGYRPQFSADSKWLVASVKPLFSQTRQAKIDKKKGDDLPQDSLAVISLITGKVDKFPSASRPAIGREGGDWVAYITTDTAYIKPKELKDKEAGRPLVALHMPSGRRKVVKNVKDFSFDRNGTKLAMTLKKGEKDSVSTDGIGLLTLNDTAFTLLDRDKLHYGAPVFNEAGTAIAFTADNDSAKTGTRRVQVYLSDLSMSASEPEPLPSSTSQLHNSTTSQLLFANQYTKPLFSHDGRRLIVGVAPVIAPDDTTIVDFEHADLDIWRWDAPQTPPEELKNVSKTREQTFPLVVNLSPQHSDSTPRLLTDSRFVTVKEGDRWDSDWALLLDPDEYLIEQQWDYTSPEKIYVVNVDNGEKRYVTTTYRENADISPKGRYVYWYDDRHYHAYDIASGDSICLTAGLPYPVWNEDDDHPMMPEPYGVAAWTEDDEYVLVYDRHDIWQLDPKGVKKPVRLTDGREKNLRYRYIKTDSEERAVKPGSEVLLSVFDFADKRNGLATLSLGKNQTPKMRDFGEYRFAQVSKAKNAPVYAFTKENFRTAPELYVSRGVDFAKAAKVSDMNSQLSEFSWGKAELVKWRAFDGQELEGILFTPDNLEPGKKYPMLSYFYETYSEELYRHWLPEPSWSWINFPFYVSRGYVIFVPDIRYTAGVPGESAYNCVVSGCEEMCRRYPFIDRDRIGIDGQSWGGYQTAFLITRTDMFACAGSGAPVANMTSAFGGIRWESGSSRQAQYEQGQSRIGRSLFEAPELYIANSPLFHLKNVRTPLLIMHNDADGAVPWYQGIELFMGLRRLGKPVWMLQYNNEAHNLREIKNRKDITIRLQQFFDHYLKDAPMPEWMRDGIPAIRKGQHLAY